MNLDKFTDNPLKDCCFESEVPEICKTQECIAGIDEAGRGPVLGESLSRSISWLKTINHSIFDFRSNGLWFGLLSVIS